MDPMTIAMGVNAVGSVLGAFGKGKNKQQALPQTGYKTWDPKWKEWAESDAGIPYLMQRAAEPYKTSVPFRRLNDEDLDPIFGSKARQELQNYQDTVGLFGPIAQQQAPQQGGSDSGFQSLGMQYAQQMAGAGTKQGGAYWKNFLSTATPAQLSMLGKELQGKQQVRGGPMAGGFADPSTGQAADIAAIMEKLRGS